MIKQSLPTPENLALHPVIIKNLLTANCVEKTKIKKIRSI